MTTGRSRSLSLTAITQTPVLIHEEAPALLRVLLGNTSTAILGRLSALDAELLARGAAPALGVDESFSAVRQRLAASLANLADRQFFLLQPQGRTRFTSEAVDLAAWERAAESHAARITAVKNTLHLPRARAPRLTLDQLVPGALGKGKAKARGARPGSANALEAGPSATGAAAHKNTKPRSRWG